MNTIFFGTLITTNLHYGLTATLTNNISEFCLVVAGNANSEAPPHWSTGHCCLTDKCGRTGRKRRTAIIYFNR